MKLSSIVNNINCKIIGRDVEISSVTFDSKNANENTLFVSLKGDGEIGHALKNGVKAIVCKREVIGVTSVVVKDERLALSKICANFYGYKKNKISVIGVVGTNGKTSTSVMLAQMLRCSGKSVATICTGKVTIGNEVIETDMTTPDPTELFKYLGKMISKKIKYCIMEVSAHAIYYKKTDAIKFSYLIFTNCTQDHLDFFETFENYKKIKMSYFTFHADKYVVNSDDETGVEILQNCKALSFGINNPADVFAINVKHYTDKITFVLNMFDAIKEISLKNIGLFNLYNFMGASCVAYCLGVNLDIISRYAKNMESVKGRCEFVGDVNGGKIFIDYAHTPDGLEKLISSFKKISKGKVYCLFGCGGNRDKGKRFKMGEISGNMADFTILTSDNPRYEEPCSIISDIESGIRSTCGKYITIQNRAEAIDYSVKLLKQNDILLVAGKGDENYQEIMGTKHKYSDRETIKSVLNLL